jgi:hypothetical protein
MPTDSHSRMCVVEFINIVDNNLDNYGIHVYGACLYVLL